MSNAIQRFLASAGLIILFALAPVTAGAQHFPPDEDIKVMLRYLIKDGMTPGIVLGILEADGSTRIVSFGTGGPGALPLGPESLFETGSVNKTFTATLLAHMVARNEVALEDPLAKYLPATVRVPSRGNREITLLDLATHSSGLPKVADHPRPADRENPYADFTMETVYTFLSTHELRREPGTAFEYSNLGFQLLGHALGQAAGMSYPDLHQQRILEPLGMTSTGHTMEREPAEWMTKGHRGGRVVPFWTGPEARLGAGGYFSNVEDMLRFLKANVGPPGTELEQVMRSAQEARAPWGEGSGRIGLAWKTDTVQGRLIVEHRGNTGGFSSLVAFDPERRVGIVMLTNTFGYSDNTPIELLAFGPYQPSSEVRLTPEALSSLAGEYLDRSGRSLYVRLEEEGYLTVQSARRARIRLLAVSDTSFTMDRGSTSLVFTKDENGVISGVRMDPSPTGETARRVGDDTPPPLTVASGTEWHQIGIGWQDGFWTLLGGLALLAMLTLGAELRRVSRKRSKRAS